MRQNAANMRIVFKLAFFLAGAVRASARERVYIYIYNS